LNIYKAITFLLLFGHFLFYVHSFPKYELNNHFYKLKYVLLFNFQTIHILQFINI